MNLLYFLKNYDILYIINKIFFIIAIKILMHFILSLILTFITTSACLAKHSKHSSNQKKPQITISTILIDMDSKQILQEKEATKQHSPASLTKLMTLYIAFSKIKAGEIGFDDKVLVSHKATLQKPSKIYLKEDDTISVYDLISSIIVHSADDSSYALAEYIAGSHETFVKTMNDQAQKLKMYSTNFENANGLDNKNQFSTARDIARLSMALHDDFKEFYPIFAKKDFEYDGRTYNTHNSIVANYDGATGLKTGFVNSSGYNIASTAKRGDHKVLAVVLGGRTAKERDLYVAELLDYGFTFLAGRPEENLGYDIVASK